MLVKNLSSSVGEFNNILDTLNASGVMPDATYQEQQLEECVKLNKRSTQVRQFLTWLKSSQNTDTFTIFYAALHEHGLRAELKILQSHEFFQEAAKSAVNMCVMACLLGTRVPEF